MIDIEQRSPSMVDPHCSPLVRNVIPGSVWMDMHAASHFCNCFEEMAQIHIWAVGSIDIGE